MTFISSLSKGLGAIFMPINIGIYWHWHVHVQQHYGGIVQCWRSESTDPRWYKNFVSFTESCAVRIRISKASVSSLGILSSGSEISTSSESLSAMSLMQFINQRVIQANCIQKSILTLLLQFSLFRFSQCLELPLALVKSPHLEQSVGRITPLTKKQVMLLERIWKTLILIDLFFFFWLWLMRRGATHWRTRSELAKLG